jgi:hypothetical protein
MWRHMPPTGLCSAVLGHSEAAADLPPHAMQRTACSKTSHLTAQPIITFSHVTGCHSSKVGIPALYSGFNNSAGHRPFCQTFCHLVPWAVTLCVGRQCLHSRHSRQRQIRQYLPTGLHGITETLWRPWETQSGSVGPSRRTHEKELRTSKGINPVD